MPRPGPQSKAKGADLDTHLALTLGPSPVRPLSSLSVLEDAWRAHRSKLIDESLPCRRPWGYWLLEDVPTELRSELPKLDRVRAAEPATSNIRRAVELEREIERVKWLARQRLLGPDEQEAMQDVIDELEAEHVRALAA
jgi:hypothetical protein